MKIPNPGKGRRCATKEAAYQAELLDFYNELLAIDASIDFTVSARGWCYLLEEYGLTKGEFNRAEWLINTGRKSGALPTDICSEDGARTLTGLEIVDNATVEQQASYIADNAIDDYVMDYYPLSQWENQDCFVIMAVEKKDLIGLFKPVCKKYRIPIANFRGWSDINSILAFMRLLQKWESKGKQCVLLYCGDHDPGGLAISNQLRKNLADLSGTYSTKHGCMDWAPDNLIIDRFGLNYEFIKQHSLSWVDNLITGSGNDLATSKEGKKEYVQDYIKKYGAKKVEANALVTRIDAGRDLCETAILKYINTDAIDTHKQYISTKQQELRAEVSDLLVK